MAKGGRRPGAGRPRSEPRVTVAVRLSQQETRDLDEARGETSRSEYVRAVLHSATVSPPSPPK